MGICDCTILAGHNGKSGQWIHCRTVIAAERIELRASQRSAFGCGAHAAVNLNRIGVLTDRCGAGDVWRIPSVKVTAHRRVIVRVRKRGSSNALTRVPSCCG